MMAHFCGVSQSEPQADIVTQNNQLYTCGCCNKSFSTICHLHRHLICHDGGGSYHYDHALNMAFPRYDTCCKYVQTDTSDTEAQTLSRFNYVRLIQSWSQKDKSSKYGISRRPKDVKEKSRKIRNSNVISNPKMAEQVNIRLKPCSVRIKRLGTVKTMKLIPEASNVEKLLSATTGTGEPVDGNSHSKGVDEILKAKEFEYDHNDVDIDNEDNNMMEQDFEVKSDESETSHVKNSKLQFGVPTGNSFGKETDLYKPSKNTEINENNQALLETPTKHDVNNDRYGLNEEQYPNDNEIQGQNENDKHGLSVNDKHGPNKNDKHGLNANDKHSPNKNDKDGLSDNDRYSPNDNDKHGLNDIDKYGSNHDDKDGLNGTVIGTATQRLTENTDKNTKIIVPSSANLVKYSMHFKLQRTGEVSKHASTETKQKLNNTVCVSGTWVPDAKWVAAAYSPKQDPKLEHMSGINDVDKQHKMRGRKKGNIPLYVVCETCGKTLRRENIECHLRLHRGETPFVCDTCGTSYTSMKKLSNHKRHLHVDSSLMRHCPVCELKFPTNARLQDHIRTHTKDFQFECMHCGKFFYKKQNMDRHIKITHTTGLQLQCPICGKKFKRTKNYEEHFRAHTQTFNCDTCGHNFNRWCSLQRHKKIHSGLKPHACHICGHAFIQKTPFWVHMEKHHDLTKEQLIALFPDKHGDKNLLGGSITIAGIEVDTH